jgi:peptidoglycan/LPS O-acetylase OafA/YrhL
MSILEDSSTPRPNVATGALAGAIVTLIFLLYGMGQGEPASVEAIIAALVPIIGFVVAYLAPAYQKTWAALIGAGLPTLLLILIGAVQGEPVDLPQLQAVLTTVVAVLLTAFVPNSKR